MLYPLIVILLEVKRGLGLGKKICNPNTIFLITKRKKYLLTITALMLCLSSMADVKKASITIDQRVKYQHVAGFGGFSPSPQWQYWLGDSEMDKLFGKGDDQLGLNILRVYISDNKNLWSSGVANIRRAKKYKAYVFASPWSPPASWKDNNQTGNGGKLLTSHWGDWATYLNDYYKYMRSQGLKIDAVSIQNEPDWSPSYSSCNWTGEELAEFLRLHGSKIQCKVIAPESVHFTKNLHEPILNDEEACRNLDIVGGHFYGWDGSAYPLAARKGKEVWMTEFLINERQQNNGANDGPDIDWKTDGFLFAKSINDAMLANMSAWVHYSLKRYYGCLGDGEFGTKDNEITKRGWILSQYAKYVSGTTRIHHGLKDASGKLSSSAYLSITGDSVVVMMINPSADTYTTNVSLPFNTKGGQHIVTTETLDAKRSAINMADETHEVDVTLEPYSVNTFLFVKTSAREDLPDTEENVEKVFADDFDMYGSGCIPTGWQAKDENGNVRKSGDYSLGPRLMGFNAEGMMSYAFYYRSSTKSAGYVSYGEDPEYRLNLDAGKYTLTYSTVGYKSMQTVTAVVLTSGNNQVAKLVSTPKVAISDNGSSIRINETTDYVLDFELKSGGNHILKWIVAKPTGGMAETLLGNVKLVRHTDESTGIKQEILLPASGDSAYYNLNGQRVGRDYHGIVIHRGKKIIKK